MNKKLLIDVAERTGWTFVQAALGVILATDGFGVDVWKAALYAGLLAAGKGLAASKIGNKESAATLPDEA